MTRVAREHAAPHLCLFFVGSFKVALSASGNYGKTVIHFMAENHSNYISRGLPLTTWTATPRSFDEALGLLSSTKGQLA